MRLILLHLLAVLLIAVFAFGAPAPAEAACIDCVDCTVEAPATGGEPCGGRDIACNPAQSCTAQIQKMPGQMSAMLGRDADEAAFGLATQNTAASAFVVPETAPPRA